MGLFSIFSLLACLSTASAPPAAPIHSAHAPFIKDAERGQIYEHPELSMTVLEVEVPFAGDEWRVVGSTGTAWTQIHIMPPTNSPSPLIVALRSRLAEASRAAEPFDVRIESSISGGERTVRIDPRTLDSGDASTLERFATARALDWRTRAALAPDSMLSMWLARHKAVYNVQLPNDRSWRARGESTSIFNVLGGRAAIRETLQMQSLNVRGDDGNDEDPETVSLAEIEEVTVVSHPFEEMLAGQDGGSIPLANLVPHDRFFAYFARPETLEGYLDGGVELLYSMSSSFTQSALDYGLVRKYFARLGLTPEAARMFLKSGAVAESAVVLSDLFVIDGTDITVILRVHDPKLLTPILSLIGVKGLESGTIVSQSLARGGNAFWAKRGDLLIVGTERGEVERALRLEDADGRGSLGQSAEFRYMLTKLPLDESSLAYVYISDPFIRRLVGPEVKIGQLRRMRARADLETLSAGALLHQFDGGPSSETIEGLATLGYVPERFVNTNYSIDADRVARSRRYGTAGDMTTLEKASFDRVRPSEAEAYRAYRENYSRFWRQFFDPIAIRLNAPGPGELEAEIFILPLIDSSIYDSLREMVTPIEARRRLPVPRLDPEPVALLSVNIQEEVWKEWIDDFDEVVARIGVSPLILEQLEPTVHFAIEDGDPVLHVGSGDLLGAFGATGGRGMGGAEMFLAPLAISAFTRPCQILIPLRDPERAIKLLSENRTLGRTRRDRDTSVDWVRVEGKNRWILTAQFFNMIQLRFGIAVDQGHLVVSNIPWLERAEIRGFDDGGLASVALRIAPGSGEKQLAGLFTAAVEGERKAAHQSAARLYPFMLVANGGSVSDAVGRHETLFGFRPAQPRGGTWSWSRGEVTSSVFGTSTRPRQPGHKPGDRNFGVLRQLEVLNVSAQLEGDGLRTQFRVKLRREP